MCFLIQINTLDKAAVMDLCRAVSIFQHQQGVRNSTALDSVGDENTFHHQPQQSKKRRQSSQQRPELRERLEELLQLLRPLLAGSWPQ